MSLVDIAEPEIFTFDGVVTEFDYPHRLRDVLDIHIVYVDAAGVRSELDYASDFLVLNVTPEGALVRFIGDPRPAGALAIAQRATPRVQSRNFYDTARPTPRMVQDALNNLAMILQDIGARADLGLKSPPEEFDATLELAPAASRAGRLFGFDENGKPEFPVLTADVETVIANREKFLELHGALETIVALGQIIGPLGDVAQVAQEIEALGDQCSLAAIECLAADLGHVLFVAEHLPAAYDLFSLAFSKGKFAALLQAGDIYRDEGPIDTVGLVIQPEGVFPDPVVLTLNDIGPVLDIDLADPPPAPSEGDAYIIAPTATGAWAGRENERATWTALEAGGFGWSFYAPQACDIVFPADEPGARYLFTAAGEWRLTEAGALLYHPSADVVAADEGFII